MPVEIGELISHYRIMEKLGEGGMGEVYLARDLDLEREVAIKFLPKELTKDEDNVERFRREARAAASLNHPNIITIYEISVSDGEHFIVMEYAKGETLRDILKREKQLPFNFIKDIIGQLGDGLEKAHEAGIVHRDIKPENVFVNEDGRVKILDFGLAKLRGSSKLTKELSTMGTINYLSPEQVRGEDATIQSDIWSSGVLFYEMITGEVPFRGEYEQAVIYGILNDHPKPPQELRADFPADLSPVIDQVLHKDPPMRYKSISQFTSELGSAETVEKQETVNLPSTRFFPTKYIYGAIVLLLVLVIVIIISVMGTDKNLDNLIGQLSAPIETGDYEAVYDQFLDSGISISELRDTDLFDKIAGYVTIHSKPGDAEIYLSRVRHTPPLHKDEEVMPGVTPLIKHALIAGEYYIRLSVSESESISFIAEVNPKDSLNIFRHFTGIDTSETEMVVINGGLNVDGDSVPAFHMDKYEVTNQAFFAFISAGGYRQPKLWPDAMIIKNNTVLRAEALNLFVDQTGIPAPRYWSGGKFAVGSENHPVVGITWYEANAYATWAGKQLPTWQQWWRAALDTGEKIFPWGDDVATIPERANFGSITVRSVGSFPLGVSPFGCMDMAGNVSEWITNYNGSKTRLPVVGGSWKNPSYMFEPTNAQSLQRDYFSTDIGFRCVESIRRK